MLLMKSTEELHLKGITQPTLSELAERLEVTPQEVANALAAADRITQQNQQGFNNALAGIQAGLTVASAAFGAPGDTGWLGKK